MLKFTSSKQGNWGHVAIISIRIQLDTSLVQPIQKFHLFPRHNAQGGGTIRQRSDGRWEACYTVGIDPGTGKQIQKSVYAKTQKEVRQKLSEKTVELDRGMYFEPKRIKLSDWLDTWLNEYMGDKKYLTNKGYCAQCNAHIKPSLGAVTLPALTPVMIQKFYNGLKSAEGNEKVLAPKSVRNVHGILSKALNQAVKIGYIRTNPCTNVTLPRVEKPDIRPLTDEQVKMFLKVAEGDEIWPAFGGRHFYRFERSRSHGTHMGLR